LGQRSDNRVASGLSPQIPEKQPPRAPLLQRALTRDADQTDLGGSLEIKLCKLLVPALEIVPCDRISSVVKLFTNQVLSDLGEAL
jgi:hypothetical protein